MVLRSKRLTPDQPTPRWALALLALSALGLVSASSGDRLEVFRSCVTSCESEPCSLSLLLRALGWSCASNCAYKCSHTVTDLSDGGQLGYHQFFGKWAFCRVLGVQEPFSVLFSLGNLWVHWKGLKMLEKRVPDSNALKPWLKAAAWIQMNTWLWSSVFHTRGESFGRRRDCWDRCEVSLPNFTVLHIQAVPVISQRAS